MRALARLNESFHSNQEGSHNHARVCVYVCVCISSRLHECEQRMAKMDRANSLKQRGVEAVTEQAIISRKTRSVSCESVGVQTEGISTISSSQVQQLCNQCARISSTRYKAFRVLKCTHDAVSFSALLCAHLSSCPPAPNGLVDFFLTCPAPQMLMDLRRPVLSLDSSKQSNREVRDNMHFFLGTCSVARVYTVIRL